LTYYKHNAKNKLAHMCVVFGGFMKKKAIIVDLDGTFANDSAAQRLSTEEWVKIDKNKYYESRAKLEPNFWCSEIVLAMFNQGYDILYVTGRNDSTVSKQITEEWIIKNSPITEYKLFMRPENDGRVDFEVKKTIYQEKIEPYYDILFAIDDIKPICVMWKSLGITSLHCGD
jgi:hypothetical protein